MIVNIDDELNKLLIKYDICKVYPEYNNSYLAKQMINELGNDFLKNKTIAIRGGGEHTEKIIQDLPIECKKNIKYIIDRNVVDCNQKEIEIISPEEINKIKVDVIIISSFSHGREMELEIYNTKLDTSVMELYSYFASRGINFTKPYYFTPGTRGEYLYYDIFINRKRYEQSVKRDDQLTANYLLNRLLCNYIFIRDFINAKKIAQILIDRNYEKDKLTSFLIELECLFNSIKEKIKQKTTRDIILNWIDGLRYKELKKTNFLNKMSKEGIFLENAYTSIPWTSQTMATMLCNKDMMEGKLYKIQQFTSESCVVLKELEERKYQFRYIGNEINKQIPKGKYRVDLGIPPKKCLTSTQLLWTSLNELLNNENNMFLLIHEELETHSPFECGENTLFHLKLEFHKEETGDLKKMVNESRDYIDKQLAWYNDLLNNNSIKIYMSDHGKFTRNIYDENILHIPFIVVGEGIKKASYSGLYPHKNLIHMLRFILDGNESELNKCFEEFINIQVIDVYNETFAKQLASENQEVLDKFVQTIGIMTKKDKYIKNYLGNKKYFIHGNDQDNHYNDTSYITRINELKKMIHVDFINPYKNDFFKAARVIYDTIKEKDLRW